jgi:hypothetical protein
VTLPIATSTFTVRRAAPGAERWEPGTLADVAVGVPGHLSVGSGSRVTTAEGTATATLLPLSLDTFAGDLRPGDVVVDLGGDGGTWTVIFAHLRPIIEHWQAQIREIART